MNEWLACSRASLLGSGIVKSSFVNDNRQTGRQAGSESDSETWKTMVVGFEVETIHYVVLRVSNYSVDPHLE